MTKKKAAKGVRAARPRRKASDASSPARTNAKPAPPTDKPARKTPSKTAHANARKASTKSANASDEHADASQLPPDFPATRYLFFGGKGGVGKTTAAASAALLLLDTSRADERVLLFSTDPAHSLSDSLGTPVGDRLVEVAPRLHAREMDAGRALDEFKTRHHAVIAEIADRGTLLDESDINELLSLSLPGLDEVMSLFELSEVDRTGEYARVVVDTAPSGHTSRMLRLPEVFSRWTGALDRLNEKHRYMLTHFARGRVRADDVELFLRELVERITRVRSVLFDAERAAFTLVTIPEEMAVEETARYFDLLASEGVPVTDLIINRVEHEHGACPFCRARARAQTRWLEKIERDFKRLRLRRVPLLAEEVRGAPALRRFAALAWGEQEKMKADVGRRKDDAEVKISNLKSQSSNLKSQISHASSPHPSSFQLSPSPALLIFGGKGGVGKTTAAASAALALAEENKKARVLVFSTDPAHSLSDSFGERVGALRRGVAGVGNLDAMEIDPAARFEELKERYRRWTDELFESLTGGSRWEIQFDREAMRELVALAPPGVDEIAALSAVSDLLDEGSYTSIVLDTAPTGHLIRFLELPEVALSWIRTFIKLLLKYKGIVRFGDVAGELVEMSKSIKRVASLLTDPARCEFVGVAIPERMSLEETARLAESLKRLKVPMRRMLINNVVTDEAARGCDFCAARRRAQTQVVKLFRRRFARRAELLAAPQHPADVRGPELLREHFASWHAL
ncbi:MAG TPA: ArsA family ATPase [Pyrinomonadaceae bacterium]|nr:ArsA family ATPase [Pyrinomonadaceae bacterium]